LNGCEDVVSIDLKTEAPKLVIEASNWYKGTNGQEQNKKLTTNPYHSDDIPVVLRRDSFYKKTVQTSYFILRRIQIQGVYTCYNFIPVINEAYTLTIK
jgi:hypothetical protein